LEIQVRSLRILHEVLATGRMVYSKRVTDLRSLFQAADREQQGALARERVEGAFSKLDLGFSPAQLTALIGTLWTAAPMTPRRGSRGAHHVVTQDVVTEEEFVAWGDPQRAELAAFMLRRSAPADATTVAEGVPPAR
jgi:hypothetical protein